MKPTRIELPAIQNWSCHGCSDCCRGQLLITLSPEEQQRLQQQHWTAADGVDPAAIMVPVGKGFRLGHQQDGACVFLDPAGRCRIHAKFGEAAKPLACRLYPLVIHPAGRKLVTGLRFSCPSAVANRGQPLSEQGREVQKLAALVVPANYTEGLPPPVAAGPPGEWPDFLRFVQWLDTTLAVADAPVALKLTRALRWLRAVEQGGFDQIGGAGADEILGALVQSATRNQANLPQPPEPPSGFGRLFLRMMVVEHARTTTVKDLASPGRYRLQMLWASLRFGVAGSRTPALRPGLKRVRFADIEQPFGPLPAAAEAMLTRFFRVKIQSLHFCGSAFHGRPLIAGFQNLALLFPVIVWLSRWLAISAGRSSVTEAHVAGAIAMVDYHHGYSADLPARVRLLSQREDIAKLCAWYGGGAKS